jgi:predicted peptidase
MAGTFLLPKIVLTARSTDLFMARTYSNARGETMPYRLFVPESYDKRKRYPLVLWLHGGAGRGQDNMKQIAGGNTSGSHVWTRPENRSKYPSLVVAPQCPEDEQWATDNAAMTGQMRLALEIVDDLQRMFSIDAGRMYVAGQSLGGFGTWAVIAEHPNPFAAAVPVCGGGDESKAPRLVHTPIWAFHGEKDEAVSVERSRRMIAAIRKAGGAPKYTEYRGAGHVIWDNVFNEPDLLPWVFTQGRV